jgi:hypothetical protein
MKNLFLTLVLLLSVSFTFAANEIEKTSTLEPTEIKKDLIDYKVINNLLYADSCNIKQGMQVISNGEMTFQYVTVFHLDGISCEDFFTAIMNAF